MLDLSMSDIRPFLPAVNFALSKEFYSALGCQLKWSDDTLALFAVGDQHFYLQHYFVQEWADNSMLHITVSDADVCFQQVQQLIGTGRFPGVRVSAPKYETYGARVTYVWDPAGVLLHLAQWAEH